MYATKTARRLRERIGRFSGDVCAGLGVVAQRFVAEMIYGIQASESVVLTEIARTLQEPIALRKTHWRLSRNLQRKAIEGVVQDNILRMAAPREGRDTLLIIDPSDVAKKYAQKMQYLATVRDGSAHDLAQGYWTLHVMGTELGTETLVPLYQRLYSADAPDFVSENAEILRAVDAVRAHARDRGLWVMDRGGDRINLFGPLLERKARFVFRLVGNRNAVVQGHTMLASAAADTVRRRHATSIVRIVEGREVRYTLRFGLRAVKLPDHEETLYLLVVDGLGEEPLLLLTTEDPGIGFKRQWRLIRAYLRRWAIEETIRYVKNAYGLENVRVLNYQGLQNLMPLLLAVMFFCACILDHDARLRVMAQYVERAAKRLFGIPDFKYYALADGLRALFVRHPGSPVLRIRPAESVQSPLFPQGVT